MNVSRFLLLAACILPAVAFPQASAYDAMRTISAERSTTFLRQVVEAQGRMGAPQPEKWLFTIKDPLARGGMREMEVAKGKIVSERTPLRSNASDTPINFQKLNLDSEGAFSLAESIARSARIRFHGADYRLFSNELGTPVWELHYLDGQKRRFGSVLISAATGQVLSKTIEGKTTQGAGVDQGGFRERLLRFSDTTNRSFRKIGDNVQEFWDSKPKR